MGAHSRLSFSKMREGKSNKPCDVIAAVIENTKMYLKARRLRIPKHVKVFQVPVLTWDFGLREILHDWRSVNFPGSSPPPPHLLSWLNLLKRRQFFFFEMLPLADRGLNDLSILCAEATAWLNWPLIFYVSLLFVLSCIWHFPSQDLRVTVTFWSLSHLQTVAPLEFCWRFSIGSKEKSWLDFHLCPEHWSSSLSTVSTQCCSALSDIAKAL